MSAKIIGFAERVNGFRTRAGKMNQDVFVKACKKLAMETNPNDWDSEMRKLKTKRQAGKFFSGKGIVFNATYN